MNTHEQIVREQRHQLPAHPELDPRQINPESFALEAGGGEFLALRMRLHDCPIAHAGTSALGGLFRASVVGAHGVRKGARESCTTPLPCFPSVHGGYRGGHWKPNRG